MAVLVTAGAAVIWGPGLWHRYSDRLFSKESCTATVGGDTNTLTAEQANNAALIVAIGTSRGLPDRAMTIALATAMQESDLRNLALGDRDSLGLFQQRPSQGWGTPEEVLDPHHATNSFYDALLRVDGWESKSLTDAAQAVQRSGFPDAYARHSERAELWATALSGRAGAQAVSCSLDHPRGSSTAIEDLRERLGEDFGPMVDVTPWQSTTGYTSAILDIAPSQGEGLITWVIATASTQPTAGVGWCDSDWRRTQDDALGGMFADWNSACHPDAVLVVLATG